MINNNWIIWPYFSFLQRWGFYISLLWNCVLYLFAFYKAIHCYVKSHTYLLVLLPALFKVESCKFSLWFMLVKYLRWLISSICSLFPSFPQFYLSLGTQKIELLFKLIESHYIKHSTNSISKFSKLKVWK